MEFSPENYTFNYAAPESSFLQEAVIDPRLGYGPMGPGQENQSPQIQRYLNEPNGPRILGASPTFLDARPAATPAVPGPSGFRQYSPVSNQPASTCGASSPPGDNEVYYEPRTPHEMMPNSPYPPQAGGTWDKPPQMLSCITAMGSGGFQGGDCIEPRAVNHGSTALYPHAADPLSFEPFDPRRSFDAISTNSPVNAPQQFDLHRQPSPTISVNSLRSEIHVRPVPSTYPPPDGNDGPVSRGTPAIATPFHDSRPNYRQMTSKAKPKSPKAGSSKRPRTTSQDAPTKRRRINNSPKINTTSHPRSASATGQNSFLMTHPVAASLSCPECHQSTFKDENGLQTHIKKQHTRPFICVFHFAGCTSTFATKNEWKRHVLSQHLLLQYWLCREGDCAAHINIPVPSPPNTATSKHRRRSHNRSADGNAMVLSPPEFPKGAIFSRKDLHTQHLRRMHGPSAQVRDEVSTSRSPSAPRRGTAAAAAATTTPEWEEHMRLLQESAMHERCKLPQYMKCPARGCSSEFNGANAWDDRMEHVAKHLEKAANVAASSRTSTQPKSGSTGEVVIFSSDDDPTLIDWASRPDVGVICRGPGEKWELCDPLRGVAGARRNSRTGQSATFFNPAVTIFDSTGELDAYGEEVE